MKRFNKMKKVMIIGAAAVSIGLTLSACSGGTGTKTDEKKLIEYTDLSAYPKSDMSGYSGMKGYDKETVFVDMTVQDIKNEMDKKSTFAFIASYSTCPYCNLLMPNLNDVALEEEAKVGYIDTRKNPEWQSNMDIDDYDLFVELFGEYLKLDESDKKHLYVPHTFFIKEGQVVYSHEGVADNLDNASDELSSEEKEEVKAAVREGFDELR